jgi:hypothetical protein
MGSYDGRRLQLTDRSLDPHPHSPAVDVSAIEELISLAVRNDLGLGAVLPDQQIGRTPDIDVGKR